MTERAYLRQSERGFGLIELMVAVVVGMLGVLAIMAVFVSSEGQKRTTTGGADASENALIALTTIERDLRMAGLGIVGLSCPSIHGYNATFATTAFSFAPQPVVITRETASDRIEVVHGTSPMGSISTALSTAMPTSTSALMVANGDGIRQGHLVLLSEGSKPCALVQASADAINTGSGWQIDHAADPAYPFNSATDMFTGIPVAGGYVSGARATNMGSLVRRQYFVQNGSLLMEERTVAPGPSNPLTVAEGIIAVRAQYGVDTSGDGYLDLYQSAPPASAGALVAMQIAVVARAGQQEKTAVSPATLVLWDGGTVANGGALALDADAQRYRYRVYKTVVPLRNVIWGNNP